MGSKKFELISKYLAETYVEFNGGFQKHPDQVTAYKFALDTGSARIILIFPRAFWEDHNTEFIQKHLDLHKEKILKALEKNIDLTLDIKNISTSAGNI